jgi:hypothetical protein
MSCETDVAGCDGFALELGIGKFVDILGEVALEALWFDSAAENLPCSTSCRNRSSARSPACCTTWRISKRLGELSFRVEADRLIGACLAVSGLS